MNVRILFAGLWLAGCFAPSFAQIDQTTQDPEARAILDKVAARAKELKSIQADFELVIEDRKDNSKNTSKGNLLIKQDKYKITTEGSVVYFNGKTMWTLMTKEKEVTITEPDKNDDDFMSNPAKIFTWYNRDFKYRFIKETTLNNIDYQEVDLFPDNLHQPYSRIKVFIDKKTELPGIITSVGKDGVNYTVYLRNLTLDAEVPDAIFSFDPLKNKKIEVEDMRGVK